MSSDLPPLKNAPACILIVEDHEDNREILQLHLQMAGYKVVATDCCARALEQARQTEFDLCVLDHCLYDGTGADLRELLRDLQPEMPALYWTGTSYSSDQITLLRQLGDDYLLKPVEPVVLKEVVGRLLADKD